MAGVCGFEINDLLQLVTEKDRRIAELEAKNLAWLTRPSMSLQRASQAQEERPKRVSTMIVECSEREETSKQQKN